MSSRLMFVALAFMFVIPVVECRAQKLKLPDLMPFKKKSREVAPFKLTDQPASRNGGKSQSGNFFDFLKPKKSEGKAAEPKFSFGGSSQQKETKVNKLAQFGRDARKFFHDAWNPPKARKAWWNQGSDEPLPPTLEAWSAAQVPANQQRESTPLANQNGTQTDRLWNGLRKPENATPIVPPRRTATQYQTGQPRHRFK